MGIAAALSIAGLVSAAPANLRNLQTLDALAHAERADHHAVWSPCRGEMARVPADASLPLLVAARGDCGAGVGARAPRDEVDAFWMGVAEARQGRREAALAIWKAHGVARYFLGAAVGKTPPEREAGILFLGYLIDLHPDDWRVLYLSGQQLRELAPDRAPAPLLRAAALNPDEPKVHAELGLVAARLSRFAESAQHYRRAHVLAPDNAAFLQGLGEAEYYAGRLQASLEAFQAKAALVPGDPSALFWIARIRSEAAGA